MKTTKAISIRQPWAWLIIHAGKDIENRTWSTKFRGLVMIHAGKKIDRAAYELLESRFDIPPIDKIGTGGIVGTVRITDCVESSPSPWFQGPFGFVLEDPKPLPFHPSKGRLGFFNVQSDF